LPAPHSRSVDVTLVSEWNDGHPRPFQDSLVGEEPLEIRVGGEPLSVTMRTPGNDLELAAGFLFTEGLIQRREQIFSLAAAEAGIEPSERGNVVEALLDPEISLELERTRRNFFSSSSCGICGKASIDAVRLRTLRPPDADFRVSATVLYALPDILRVSQAIFGRTGGLHAAALFSAGGEMMVAREDVGRHNAVDKIVGWALLNAKLPLTGCVLLVSGRASFELVQKAVLAGIPLLAAVSAPSSLAAELAEEAGLTLIGFLRGPSMNVYTGAHRVAA